ncbi:hypothetical protein A9995_11425 [Erythrobacter sp. QSSC1-22B]|uniref:hypothetical protein n=1 Tax=Erythrobacter sp. QSSC1-22B TaxID=1860125 RepID=UPI000805CC08|nr:hypothetical protein [Erythrobacter sp. QSSC1-22B]OBX18570.1 hypothetical protein A9995_11425 [Erythrobacter sp. QSSC1-22B]
MNSELDPFANEPLVIAGRKIDGRTTEARRFRSLAYDLAAQLQRNPTPAERALLLNAATLATLCERFTADLLEGKPVEDEPFRRNVAALSAVLIKLGMAAKSRDVTKRDRNGVDEFGAALIEANAR